MASESHANKLRIIAGDWRGTVIPFPDRSDLRPTSNRVRETLFNWLRNDIAGARCLDLYAGSGSLGFEALSRGAKEVTFVDREGACVASIRQNLLRLDAAARSAVLEMSATEFFANAGERGLNTAFDIVFLDPPFADRALSESLAALPARLLHPKSLIYVESAAKIDAEQAAGLGYIPIKEKQAGQVHFGLLSKAAGHPA